MNTVSKPFTQSNAGYGSQKFQYNTRIESSADPAVEGAARRGGAGDGEPSGTEEPGSGS